MPGDKSISFIGEKATFLEGDSDIDENSTDDVSDWLFITIDSTTIYLF